MHVYLRFCLLPILTLTSLNAQVGINTENPHVQSDLHLGSLNKGLILNHVEDYMELDDPQEGMIIYDKQEKCFKGYTDKKWTDCFGEYIGEQKSMPVVSVDGPGFTGNYYTNQTLTDQTFEVRVSNNSFNSVKIDFSVNDLVLNHAELTVSSIKYKTSSNSATLQSIPTGGIELNPGAEVILIYGLSGKPINSGKLIGEWNKITLNYTNETNIIFQLDCTTGYWSQAITPYPSTGLMQNTVYEGKYRIPYSNAENQIFEAEILRNNGLIFKRNQTIGSDNSYIEYTLKGTYTGENAGNLTFVTLEGCVINIGDIPKIVRKLKQ